MNCPGCVLCLTTSPNRANLNSDQLVIQNLVMRWGDGRQMACDTFENVSRKPGMIQAGRPASSSQISRTAGFRIVEGLRKSSWSFHNSLVRLAKSVARVKLVRVTG